MLHEGRGRPSAFPRVQPSKGPGKWDPARGVSLGAGLGCGGQGHPGARAAPTLLSAQGGCPCLRAQLPPLGPAPSPQVALLPSLAHFLLGEAALILSSLAPVVSYRSPTGVFSEHLLCIGCGHEQNGQTQALRGHLMPKGPQNMGRNICFHLGMGSRTWGCWVQGGEPRPGWAEGAWFSAEHLGGQGEV